ncbi:MAG TPA: zincin-like metallopeptidase domain-containing protein, partial [Chloroflexota bacterium]|nr:zincin-like metallopeptidase domain-containing protein [Chloroflexota bacterium]
ERFTGTATSTPTEGYYGVLLHELTHWSGHESRTNRDLSGRFGKEAYAMEELVAELGSAFLCAEKHITPQPRPDHAAYIANWLKVPKDDKRAIFSAASKASQASQYLNRLQEKAQARTDAPALPEQPAGDDPAERSAPDPALWQQRTARNAGRQLGLF